MKKLMMLMFLFCFILNESFAQSKTIIGVVPFKNSYQGVGRNNRNLNSDVHAIQDAVTDVFMKTKRFSLVEREKMDQIKSEKNLQKNEDFIDGQVIEQSKSLGAQYIVVGNVSKAEESVSSTRAPFAGTITSQSAEIAFNIKVIDVATGEIMASNSFEGSGKGKNAMENALKDVKPDIEKFIKENFKITISIASIEEKNNRGDAVKVLIAGGTSLGMKETNELKVYEAKEMLVDGKKMIRKVTVGKIVVAKVEDENFSVCTVTEGGEAIAKKVEEHTSLKCEIINE